MRAIAAISFVWQKSISDDIECKMEEGNFTKIDTHIYIYIYFFLKNYGIF